MRGAKRKPTPHLGAQLHARNRYKDAAPDFYALAELYPSFKQYVCNVNDVKRTASLAWDDPFAVRELTKTLLLHDFQLQWTMPIDRLCPPLPNRLNYLHWIEDLLLQANVNPFASASASTSTTNNSASRESPTPICGIDIGTGASCIYALLGARMNHWKFIATEIDPESYASAKENVARNALASKILVMKVETDRLLQEPLGQEDGRVNTWEGGNFHFSMCNPPFFADMSQADTNPETCCTGSKSEMVCSGGEVAFITNMIEDSLVLKSRVLWYTSMIGRKSSIRKILAVLREKQVPHTRTTEFFQGRTKRWGIAWTFANDLVGSETAESKVLGKRKEAHRRQELVFSVPAATKEGSNSSQAEVVRRVREFADGNQLITIADAHGEHEEEDDGDGNSRDATSGPCALYTFLRLQSAGKPDSQNQDAFQGRIEISSHTNSSSNNSDANSATLDFEVIVTYEAGDRQAFWKTADALKAATVRSGRQWRRKRQHVEGGGKELKQRESSLSLIT